jgi:hypothetical protein
MHLEEFNSDLWDEQYRCTIIQPNMHERNR